MSTFSLTGIGAILTVFFTLLKLFNVDIPDGMDKQVGSAIETLVSLAILIYGQVRRKDLVAGIIRK